MSTLILLIQHLNNFCRQFLKMEIICNFVELSETFFRYNISDCTLPEKIYNLKVTHPPNKSNADVKYLKIANCGIKKIPQRLSIIFPNLEILEIYNSNLEKIFKVDLEEYKNLKEFYCDQNSLEYLSGNLFEGFNNLERFSFAGNDIKVIEPTILDDLKKLNFVYFNNNDNYNCCFSSDDNSETLDEFKDKLYKIFCSNSENVKKIIKKYENKVKRLTASNIKHVAKNQNLEESNRRYRVINQDYTASSIQSAIDQGVLRSEIKRLEDVEKSLTREIQKLKLNPKEHQSSFNRDIKNLTKNDNFKDFIIQIDDQEFKVHKFLLAARSPTLADIFLANPEAENLKLVDIAVDTFEKILHFMYNDELPGDKDGVNFLQLYSAAGRLGIDELKNVVAKKF